MKLFDWLTLVSLIISISLSINEFRKSNLKLEIDNISSQIGISTLTLRFVLSNRSSQYRVVTDAYIYKNNECILKADIYEKVIAYSNHRNKDVLEYRNEIKSNEIPINTSPNSAMAILMSFPIDDIDLKNKNADLKLKIGKKYISKGFYISGTNELQAELKRAARRK